MTDFVGLRAKMYSYQMEDGKDIKKFFQRMITKSTSSPMASVPWHMDIKTLKKYINDMW